MQKQIAVPYLLTSLEDVLAHLDTSTELMFDTETDGFYGTIELAQFYQEHWKSVLMVRRPDVKELCQLLDSVTVVLQNAAYDISTIQTQLSNDYCIENFEDTLLLGRLHFFTQMSFTLDNLMFLALGYDPYLGQGLDKKVLQKAKWSGDLTEDQLLYAATDVYFLPQVWNAVKHKRDDENYILDMITLRHCFELQQHGMPVDERKRMILQLQTQMEIDEIACPINVNSYQQVRPYIGESTSDGLALAGFTLDGNERAEEVMKARKALKLNSFVVKKFKTEDHRIYGKFAPSTRSGRLSCKDQNLQQLPRKSKGIFGFTDEDSRVLVYADFSQLELRCACAIIGDRMMNKLFKQGEDLHSYTAHFMFGDVITKEQRTVAKACNFNLLYGGSANMLGDILVKDFGMRFSDQELVGFKTKWLKLWKDIAQWQRASIVDWRKGRYNSTPLGRRYLGKLMTDHLNIKIQGSGADVAKLAFHKIMPQIAELPEVKMCDFIHDSFIIESPDKPAIYERTAEIVGLAMKTAWEDMSQFFRIKDLPNPVNVYVGKNWGDIEDGNEIIYEVEF